jgi:hypothetical protein
LRKYLRFGNLKNLKNQILRRRLFDIGDDSLDQDLYAILNPDVVSFPAGILAHWNIYGKKENRIGQKNFFFSENIQSILKNNDLEKFSQLHDLFSSDIVIKEAYSIRIPWTIGCWGRPSEIFLIKIITFKPLFVLKKKIHAEVAFLKRISPRQVRIYLRKSLNS